LHIRYQQWKKQILELFNMKLSKTIDQTRICKKSYDDPLGYFCMGFFFLLVPTDKWPTHFTCPTDVSTYPGQSDKRYCRGLIWLTGSVSTLRIWFKILFIFSLILLLTAIFLVKIQWQINENWNQSCSSNCHFCLVKIEIKFIAGK
jgi:hypothetical protein